MEYIVFIDESSITKHRFPSLSAFSLPLKYYQKMSIAVNKIITESKVSEFKWSKLRNARYYLCAKKILDLIIQDMFKLGLRVDTIVWDTHDSRHRIIGRDDMANYERMFFHLLRDLMKRRPRGGIWHIRPDVGNGIDWKTIHRCLFHVNGS